MLFNSTEFLKFFAAFALLYWLVRGSLRWRNVLIVAGSCLFYGWWNPWFLILILISTVLDFFIGLALKKHPNPKHRKQLLAVSISASLGILGVFKYYDFFAASLGQWLVAAGWSAQPWLLHVILPVGISFYTFQTMSYTIDVYRGHIEPTRNFIDFMAYVTFFPQLVAGPIERATHLLPQFARAHVIDRAMVEEGVWLIVWGMFKKVVIADNLAPLVEMIYGGTVYSGSTVVLATVAFGFQIYCDFSGYSDIARGLARLLGFDIMVNFNLPYWTHNLREFWQRWHISLSTWLRDYLYIPLGGNRKGPARTSINLLLTLVLAGLWHGAAWNFVLWGLLHGIGVVVYHRWHGRARPTPSAAPGGLSLALSWFGTMVFVFYGWLLFRADSLNQIQRMTIALLDWSCPVWMVSYLVNLGVFILPLLAMEMWQWKNRDRLVALKIPTLARAGLQGVLLLAIIYYWETGAQPFIYFQF